jgi:hypothetical protein
MSLVSCWLFLGQLVDFFGDVDGRLGLYVAQFFDFSFEFRDRLLEIEEGLFRQRAAPQGF